MFELVIFDCDGVLVDTERTANEVLARYLSEFGADISAEECHLRFVGTNVPNLATILREEGFAVPDDFIDEVRRRILAALAAGVEAIPGVHDVLAGMRHPFCLASSGRHVKIRQSLRLADLDRFFDDATIFSAEDVERAKPAPDLFLHAAERMGVDPGRAVVVEDSPPGIIGAAAAGMTVIAYAGQDGPADDPLSLGAHRVIRHMNQLPALLIELETMS